MVLSGFWRVVLILIGLFVLIDAVLIAFGVFSAPDWLIPIVFTSLGLGTLADGLRGKI